MKVGDICLFTGTWTHINDSGLVEVVEINYEEEDGPITVIPWPDTRIHKNEAYGCRLEHLETVEFIEELKDLYNEEEL